MKKFGTFLIEKTPLPSEYRRNPFQSHIKHREQGKPYEFLRDRSKILSRSNARETELLRG